MKKLIWLFDKAVLIAGLLNAGGMSIQAHKLFQTQDPSSFSPIMYFVFLFIQLIYAINGVRHKDRMQAIGMFLSMVPTTTIIAMIYIWR